MVAQRGARVRRMRRAGWPVSSGRLLSAWELMTPYGRTLPERTCDGEEAELRIGYDDQPMEARRAAELEAWIARVGHTRMRAPVRMEMMLKQGVRETSATPRGSVAPRILDPALAIVERIDRWVRRVEPVAPGSVLALERRRHRGPEVTLADGTAVRAGDGAWAIHLDNRLLKDPALGGWQRGASAARADLLVVARRHAALPEGQRPVAYTGITLLGPLVRRAGFEVRPRPRSWWARLEDWYLRSLLVRWSPDGRNRLLRGHRPLVAERIWMSAAELIHLYGAPLQ